MNNQNFNNGNNYQTPYGQYNMQNTVPVNYKYHEAFSSGLFLALCILSTIQCALLAFFAGTFNIFSILITVGLWMTYSSAKSDMNVKKSGLNLISTMIFITYIMNWIAVGGLLIGGSALIGASFAELEIDNAQISDKLYTVFEGINLTEIYDKYLADINWQESIGSLFVIIGIGMFISAIIMVLINVFYTGRLRTFSKSIAENTFNPTPHIEYARYISIWFLVLGILQILNPTSGGVSLIVAYVFVQKYFVEKKQPEIPNNPYNNYNQPYNN